MTVELKRNGTPIPIPTIFNRPTFQSLFDKIPETKLKKGEVIFKANNARHYVYFVTKGMVKLYSYHDGKEMLEDYFLKGELFNCSLIVNKEMDGLAAEAMTQLTAVKKLPVQNLRQAIESNLLLYKDVLTSISTSLDRSQERLRRITLLNSRKRVIHFLYHHAKNAGRRVGYEFVVKPAITHKEIGTLSGTSRQTATTVLNELRSKGVIHFNRSYLIVRDLDALGKMTVGD